MGKIMVDGEDFTGVYLGAHPEAKDQIYDSSNATNVTANNVQDAISELDSAVNELNTTMQSEIELIDNRTVIVDLIAEADKGLESSRMVYCTSATLNTPYTEGLTGTYSAAIAYINMTSSDYGNIVYCVSGAKTIYIKYKCKGTWDTEWSAIHADNLPKVIKTGNATNTAIEGEGWFKVFEVKFPASIYWQSRTIDMEIISSNTVNNLFKPAKVQLVLRSNGTGKYNPMVYHQYGNDSILENFYIVQDGSVALGDTVEIWYKNPAAYSDLSVRVSNCFAREKTAESAMELIVVNPDSKVAQETTTESKTGIFVMSDILVGTSNQVLTYSDVTVATTDWVSSGRSDKWIYSANIACDGVTADHVPNVTFLLSDATSGNYAPSAITTDGNVTIFAKTVPSANISIQSIQCIKSYSGVI